jgi:hypothetical protein
MKKVFSFIALISIIGIIAACQNIAKYTVKDTEQDVKLSIEKLLSTSSNNASKIVLKKTMDIDNRKFAAFIYNNFLGDAEFTKGPNNKYRLQRLGHGNDSFRMEVQQTNKNKYFVIVGKNPNMRIDRIEVTLEGNIYNIQVPKEEYFIVYCQIPRQTVAIYAESHRVFDEKDNDITFQILD